MDLVYKIKKIIKKEALIESGDRVLAGVSGGIDSTVMFFILLEISREIPFEIGIAHINHLLRGKESKRDEIFVRNLAKNTKAPFFAGRFDVEGYAEEKGLSLQHAGRDLRYMFFRDIADRNGYNRIAVAHNLDDQVETFLLRLIKGTGLRGLSSIPVKKDKIIRPFLHTYRTEIAEYAEKKSIQYVEDSSNKETYYERNYLRKNIIPLMERLNPAFKEKVFLLLKDITEIDRVFEKNASDFLDEGLFSDKDGFWVEKDRLKLLDGETRFRVISNILMEIGQGFIPLREHMRLIDKVINAERPSLSLNLPDGIRVKKVYDKLRFTKKMPAKKIEGVFPVQEGINILEPFGLILEVEQYRKKDIIPFIKPLEGRVLEDIAFFDGDKIGALSVRCFSEGDRFMPLGMDKKVKVKDFFISKKVPSEIRRTIPFLVSDGDIIWVIGHRIDERYKITEKTTRVVKVATMPLYSDQMR